MAYTAYAGGGITAALDAIKNAPSSFGASDAIASLLGKNNPNVRGKVDIQSALGAERSTADEKISTYDQLVQLQNSQTTDKSLQASNIKDEIAYFQTLPSSIARDQKITDLTKTMQDLISSTDDLTKSNGDLLSPYYSQDPRTSHIGFRSQGMASTGYIDIPGVPSTNDNMTLTLPVASGERVNVGNGPNRGAPNITFGGITIVVQGNADEKTVNAIGRTTFQALQEGSKKLLAASQ